jgi:actin-related protein
MALVIPSALPRSLLSTILDSLFSHFQPPTISLMSAPVLTTVAAGVRAALVVDIGWAETVVSGVYEYREVQCKRSIRATKLYGEEMFKMLVEAIGPTALNEESSGSKSGYEMRETLSFEECEEINIRMGWCQPAKKLVSKATPSGLTPVKEEDELRSSMMSLQIRGAGKADPITSIPLLSTTPPRTLRIPCSKLAEPCEIALFGAGRQLEDFDEEELPLHLLVYRSLLQLPVDLRSMCMARIVFVGGGSNILGLKERVMDEVAALIENLGWDPVRGKAVEQYHSNAKLQNRRRQSSNGPIEVPNIAGTTFVPKTIAALVEQEPDPIEDQLKREASKGRKPVDLGFLRAIESLGAWSGGSLLSQLKIPTISIVDREQWLQHGAAGASREIDINMNAKRQSMGPAAFKAGAGDRTSWTLGLWG